MNIVHADLPALVRGGGVCPEQIAHARNIEVQGPIEILELGLGRSDTRLRGCCVVMLRGKEIDDLLQFFVERDRIFELPVFSRPDETCAAFLVALSRHLCIVGGAFKTGGFGGVLAARIQGGQCGQTRPTRLFAEAREEIDRNAHFAGHGPHHGRNGGHDIGGRIFFFREAPINIPPFPQMMMIILGTFFSCGGAFLLRIIVHDQIDNRFQTHGPVHGLRGHP